MRRLTEAAPYQSTTDNNLHIHVHVPERKAFTKHVEKHNPKTYRSKNELKARRKILKIRFYQHKQTTIDLVDISTK